MSTRTRIRATTVYSSKKRSTITYAAPAWMTFLSDSSLQKLDKVERRALSVIFPGKSYEDALEAANLPSLRAFCGCMLKETFYKILGDLNHPLYARSMAPVKPYQKNVSFCFYFIFSKWLYCICTVHTSHICSRFAACQLIKAYTVDSYAQRTR